MAYQVLARKWRPRNLQTVMGHSSVIRALSNALDQNRLHHAYLFTGTRGVGKTTLARILAKCLNCETKISSTPCNTCTSCQEIDQGRFIDLIEVDAASRTRIEDTRELLDNVQYAPTKGRFKIYLIDEVHMLSGHSFNALLKTLEEPPEHVKFLLATTDPQKLPVTVLSRCLQFHLKNLSIEQISQQLTYILEQEKIAAEPEALAQLARVANGSMRDALSLLDQALAYGNNVIRTDDIKTMLGMTDTDQLIHLLDALAAKNTAGILDIINQLAEKGADFSNVLDEVISLLHKVAVIQALPDAILNESKSMITAIKNFANALSKEDVQLYYQIGLIGKRDLSLSPTPRSGFEMILLRMLLFTPNSHSHSHSNTPSNKISTPSPAATGSENLPNKNTVAKMSKAAPIQIAPIEKTTQINPPPAQPIKNSEWSTLLAQLNLRGATLALASHCVLIQQTEDTLQLMLDNQQAPLLNPTMQQRIKEALEKHLNKPIQLIIEVGKSEQATPALIARQAREQQLSHAIQSVTNDQNVQALMSTFNAKIVPNSVETLEE